MSLGNSTEKAVSKSRRLKYTLLLKPSSRRQMFDVQHAMSLTVTLPTKTGSNVFAAIDGGMRTVQHMTAATFTVTYAPSRTDGHLPQNCWTCRCP